MKIDLPPERRLDDKQSRVARILEDADRPTPRHPQRRGLVPVVAALAAAAFVAAGVGVAGLVDGDDGGGEGADVARGGGHARTAPTPDKPADVDLGVGELAPDRAVALADKCGAMLGSTLSTFTASELISAQVQRSPVRGGQYAVVIAADEATGEVVGCEADVRPNGRFRAVGGGLMGGPGSKSTVNENDATHPAIPTDGPGGFSVGSAAATYQVDDRVAAMRRRWVIDGAAGPWFVATPVGGYVYLQSWVAEGALDGARRVVLETQVLDASGALLDAPGDQVGGGGISPSPGKTRRDDLCQLTPAGYGAAGCR